MALSRAHASAKTQQSPFLYSLISTNHLNTPDLCIISWEIKENVGEKPDLSTLKEVRKYSWICPFIQSRTKS